MLYYCTRIQFSRNSWFALLITIRSIFLLLSFRRQTGPIFVTRDWDFVKLIKITLCIHIGMSLSLCLALAVDAFCFRLLFGAKRTTTILTSKEGQRSVNVILSITSIAMGLCTNFFPSPLRFFYRVMAWLGLAYGSGFFTSFLRFRSFQGMGTERHSTAQQIGRHVSLSIFINCR